MPSTLLDLPSGGTIDLTNFVAIVPLEQSDRHQILFSGLSQTLTLDRTDATAVKMFLSTQTSTALLSEHNYGSIELKKVNAVTLMAERIAKHQNMTDEEDAQSAESFERFKQLIDQITSTVKEEPVFAEILAYRREFLQANCTPNVQL